MRRRPEDTRAESLSRDAPVTRISALLGTRARPCGCSRKAGFPPSDNGILNPPYDRAQEQERGGEPIKRNLPNALMRAAAGIVGRMEGSKAKNRKNSNVGERHTKWKLPRR